MIPILFIMIVVLSLLSLGLFRSISELEDRIANIEMGVIMIENCKRINEMTGEAADGDES